MDNFFFSIILPTYNRAHMLAKAIESVLAQTFTGWELIIVDDGSKDNTRDVVAAYHDKRIKYIYQDNAERSAARNKGIKNARGLYITFLDSDDYFLPDRMHRLHHELTALNLPEALTYTGLLIEDDQGQKQEMENYNPQASVFDNIATAIIHSQQVAIHRNIFARHLYNPALTVGEDMELWLRIALDFPVKFIPHSCNVVVVQHDDRSINLKKYNSSIKHRVTYKHIFGKGHPGNNISGAIAANMISACFFDIGKYEIYQHRHFTAAWWLIRSLLAAPGHPQTRYKLNILRWLVFNPAKAARLLA